MKFFGLFCLLATLCNCTTTERISKLENPPSIGKTVVGQEIFLGGLSGLFADKHLGTYYSITDRGPNGEPIEIPGKGTGLRPFLIPSYCPKVVKFEHRGKTLHVLNTIDLKDPAGKPLSGLPNFANSADEKAIDAFGNLLKPNLMGIDSEGIAFDRAGNIWVSEEYRPSLLKFDSEGRLISRFVPHKSYPQKDMDLITKMYGREIIKESFPEKLNARKINRGFEGLSYFDEKLFLILQSPMPTKEKKIHQMAPLYVWDLKTEIVISEYFYKFSEEDVDKVGDLAVYAPGKALVIEQSSTSHKIYAIDFNLPTGSVVLKKLVLNLEEAGFEGYQKIEGIALVDKTHIAILSDNDFGLSAELDYKSGKIGLDKNKKTVLGILKLKEPLHY